MIIIGINAFHADSSACIVRDGVLLAAVEEERFRRIKHWAGFPSQAIKWCLEEADATLGDVDYVAVNQDTAANSFQRAQYLIKARPDLRFLVSRLRNRQKRAAVADLLEELIQGQSFRGKVHAVEHHLAHLSSAFHVSPFQEAVAVSVDGFGDFASSAWGVGQGTQIEVTNRVYFPHSLGIFYQAITQFLGFENYGDEYKVMGLAPYGQPRYVPEIRRLVELLPDGRFTLEKKYFRHHKHSPAFQWADGSPEFDHLFTEELEALLGPRRSREETLEQRHIDIARSAQAVYEEAFINLIEGARAGTGLTDIVIAGGCGNNSVANGKIRRTTPFKRVYVHAAPGDQGGAIGAAFAVWHQLGGERKFTMNHAYWGPSFRDDDIEALLSERASHLREHGCVIVRASHEGELCERTAESIAQGKVVGWFQGRMEWGPRALGNRSILGDPRRADMKEVLNTKIKRRESFRPFAPSVLAERVSDWFEEDDAVPFMMQVFQIRKPKRPLIPAVSHVDGSGRLQTVTASANPIYHRLIKAFETITGIPMVLNTSFNENEPIVCRPQDALMCFLRTQMDVLVLGCWIIKRDSRASIPESQGVIR